MHLLNKEIFERGNNIPTCDEKGCMGQKGQGITVVRPEPQRSNGKSLGIDGLGIFNASPVTQPTM